MGTLQVIGSCTLHHPLNGEVSATIRVTNNDSGPGPGGQTAYGDSSGNRNQEPLPPGQTLQLSDTITARPVAAPQLGTSNFAAQNPSSRIAGQGTYSVGTSINGGKTCGFAVTLLQGAPGS